MGYQIRKKKKDGAWFLFYVRDSGKGGVTSRTVHPGEGEYAETGLRPEMGIEEARRALESFRRHKEVLRHAARRHRILGRLNEEAAVEGAYLSRGLSVEFEAVLKRNRIPQAHWHTARKVILAIGLHPKLWYEESDQFYAHLEAKGYSNDYVKKLMRAINEYGYFYSKRVGTPWRDVKNPRGHWNKRIRKAQIAKRAKAGHAAYCVRMRPEELNRMRSRLEPQEWAWLWVALWFGLRPAEVDRRDWRFGEDERGRFVEVIQEKVDGAPKIIPLLVKAQYQAAELMKGPLKRPSRKKMVAVFGKAVRLYSCRKGFVNLMDEERRSIPEISAWLGHSSITTTMRYYWDIKRRVLENR